MERHNKPEVEYGRNPELLLEPARSAAAPLPCCAVELDPPCADAIAMLARAGGAVPQRERALHDRGEHQQCENKHQGVTLRICAVRSQLRSAQTHPTAVQVKQSDELEEILAKKFLVSNLRHPRSSALAAALRRRRAWGRLRRSLPFPPRRDSWRRGRMRSKCFAESPSRRAAASPGLPPSRPTRAAPRVKPRHLQRRAAPVGTSALAPLPDRRDTTSASSSRTCTARTCTSTSWWTSSSPSWRQGSAPSRPAATRGATRGASARRAAGD